jgi:hypothetical protein
MKSNSKRAILALAIIVPVAIVGAVVWSGQQPDSAAPSYSIEQPTEDSGVVMAAPTAEEPTVDTVAAVDDPDDNPLKPIGPKGSDRLPSQCGSCGA